jgi:hypothetical protein
MCPRFRNRRRGLSLVELLTATAILMVVAGAIAALAATVQTSNQHGQGHATATQHAQVALERLERAVREAHASAEFPGFAVFEEQIGEWRYPDTLVVWRPAGGVAANPAGLPLFRELVVFRPDPEEPNVLLEITVADDLRTAPALAETAQWKSDLANLHQQGSYQAIALTDLVRTAKADGASVDKALRGVVRFELEQTPSDDDLADFRAGTTLWKDLPWVQGIRGATVGLRQSRLRVELQLIPDDEVALDDADGMMAVPFFGGASLLYEVHP